MAQLPEPNLANGDTGTVGRDDDLLAPDGDICPVCHELFDRPTRTACKHWFCLCAAPLIFQDYLITPPACSSCIVDRLDTHQHFAWGEDPGFTAAVGLLCG